MIRDINGTPYSFVQITTPEGMPGWAVGCRERMTDRFHRNYTVRLTADGMPKNCTCAHHMKRGAYCKHMQEIEKITRESDPIHDTRLAEEAVRCGF